MRRTSNRIAATAVSVLLFAFTVLGQETDAKRVASTKTKSEPQPDSPRPTLAQAKAAGAYRSEYRKPRARRAGTETPQPRLTRFRVEIEPILRRTCLECHGPDMQEAGFRVDTLDPNLLHGGDVDWWLEVVDVLSNGEMPPEDDAKLPDEERSKVIEWLSSEIQTASQVRRSEQGHSSFRRMTRYEYNYALQDLLGLPYDFAQELPPEAESEDGFKNSSEMLQMSVMQFEYYRQLGRKALSKAIVRGDRPELIFYDVTMHEAAARMGAKKRAADPNAKKDQGKKKRDAKDAPWPDTTHFRDLETGEIFKSSFNYRGGEQGFAAIATRPEVPASCSHVLIIPAKRNHKFDLGDFLPEKGTLRIRIKASRISAEEESYPSLRLSFGFQASNDSNTSNRISDQDVGITALPGNAEIYEWDIPLSELIRNPYRGVNKLGDLPNPAEYLMVENVHQDPSKGKAAAVQIEYLQIIAPVYEQWPPESHTRLFFDGTSRTDETAYAREVLARFMPRAWRRRVAKSEVDQKVALYSEFRSTTDDFQEAMIEVLATILSSPNFLYLSQSQHAAGQQHSNGPSSDDRLATRLAIFLWCSTPDDELLDLAAEGRLSDPDILIGQVKRMLADEKAERFSRHFVRQWLGMQLLDYLDVNRKSYPHFDRYLKESMQEEPVAFFHEILQQNHSVVDFIHADYTMVDQRLAGHYGLPSIYGNHFRKVWLSPEDRRGGLLTQAGLLAMNSDGKDSHPLKRGIWMLESLLNDPPPPPPPAVPEIDLADPEIAKMSLKQRIENHRNHAACMSCHAKIDPWGIPFENFDAIGSWREAIDGTPVDATSQLFNKQRLDGMDGLKRYLLANRQDQFTRAMVHKLTTFALGRPLTFGDRSEVDRITADLRQQGDGLATLVKLIVTSELFRS